MFVQTKIDILARLVTCASTDPVRPYISGVHVRPAPIGGVIVEATNGHILSMEHDPDGRVDHEKGKSRIVSPAAIKTIVAAGKALAKAWRVDDCDLRVTISGNGYEISSGDARSALTSFPPPDVCPFLDFAYPEVDRIMPAIPFDAAPIVDCYNVNLLHTLVKSARTLAKKSDALVYRLFAYEQGTPARVRVAGADRWLGVIMPMRCENIEGPRAVWEYRERDGMGAPLDGGPNDDLQAAA